MTNKNIYNKQNTLINHANANIKIKLSMLNGQLAGNIVPKPETGCQEGTLDFSCPDNSGLIGLI